MTTYIKHSLRQLAAETAISTNLTSQNFARDVLAVEKSVAKIQQGLLDSEQTVGQRAALQALASWSDNPNGFATTTTRPAIYGMSILNASDGPDLKCNRFVAEMASAGGFSFPLGGFWKEHPISAEDIYNKGINNTKELNAKEAKIGDIISFPGHVGIYLGSGLYVSARHSNKYLGTQSPDGVQITRVLWDLNPKILRMNERQTALNSGGDQSFTVSDPIASAPVTQIAANDRAIATAKLAEEMVNRAIGDRRTGDRSANWEKFVKSQGKNFDTAILNNIGGQYLSGHTPNPNEAARKIIESPMQRQNA